MGFITPIIAGVLLIIGVLGIVFKNRFALMIAKINPLFPAKMTLSVITIVALVSGGITGIGALWSMATATITGEVAEAPAVEGVSTFGAISVQLSDGIVNASSATGRTTTEDYLNDAEDFMTFYSADASIIDGEEYIFNATIQRSAIAEDANLKVTCASPDKELSGVTADNLITKTAGQINLDYLGTTSTGTHSTDNEVWTYVAFAEGVGSQEIEIGFDHVEAYHDGMADLDDYVDVTCDVEGVPFTARVYANS